MFVYFYFILLYYVQLKVDFSKRINMKERKKGMKKNECEKKKKKKEKKGKLIRNE